MLASVTGTREVVSGQGFPEMASHARLSLSASVGLPGSVGGSAGAYSITGVRRGLGEPGGPFAIKLQDHTATMDLGDVVGVHGPVTLVAKMFFDHYSVEHAVLYVGDHVGHLAGLLAARGEYVRSGLEDEV